MFPPIKNIKYLSEVPLGFCCTLSFSPFNQLGAAGLGFFWKCLTICWGFVDSCGSSDTLGPCIPVHYTSNPFPSFDRNINSDHCVHTSRSTAGAKV